LDGTINDSDFELDPYFGVEVPTKLDDIDSSILIPSKAWDSEEDYAKIAERLVDKFQNNFAKYDIDDEKIRNAGPKKVITGA
jgi:phosphoenolpyruvate carboxykinase (ATP)